MKKKEFKSQNNLLKFIGFSSVILLTLIFSILSNLTMVSGISLFLLLFLGVLLFLKPLWGLIVLIILRPAIDLAGTQPFFSSRNLFVDINLNSLLGLLVVVWGAWVVYKNRQKINKLPAIISIVLFLLITIFSVFLSPNAVSSLREFIRILSIFSLYAIAFFLVKSKDDKKKLINGIILSSFIPVSVGLAQRFMGEGEVIFGEFFRRIYGTFFYPNSLAFFLVLVIGLALERFYRSKKISFKVLYAGLILLYFFVLLGTYTRGAWIGIILLFLVFSALKLPRLLLAGFLILVLIYFLGPTLQERINDVISLEPFSSLIWRFRLWRNTLPFFYEKPLLGHGIGSFQSVSQKLQGLSTLPAPEAHNDYLRLLIETGVLGVLTYFAIQLRLAIFFLKNYFKKKDKYLKSTNLIVFLLIGVFLVMAFGDNVIRGTATQWTLFTLIGATASLNLGFKK